MCPIGVARMRDARTRGDRVWGMDGNVGGTYRWGESVSRLFSSFSIASRMNAAMRWAPTSTSMRRRTSSLNRTSVGFTFNGGRPMRGAVSDIGNSVKTHSVSDIAY
jgi:hypothetical protein